MKEEKRNYRLNPNIKTKSTVLSFFNNVSLMLNVKRVRCNDLQIFGLTKRVFSLDIY